MSLTTNEYFFAVSILLMPHIIHVICPNTPTSGSIRLLRSARRSLQTFLFLFCFFFFLIFSLPPSASLDFSLISQPISMKFGILIVLDETKRCLKFQVNRTRGRDRAWSQSLLCFIIGKTLYTVRRDKNFT